MNLRTVSISGRSGPFRTGPWLSGRRPFSSKSVRGQTAFSYSVPPAPTWTKAHQDAMLREIGGKSFIANPTGHDAAVLLVSPAFARTLDDRDFMAQLVQTLSGSATSGVPHFHLVSAVVDHLAPTFGSFEPLSGFSIMRGHLDEMLPQLWDPDSVSPDAINDADAVSALTFHIGAPSVTLPLARTPFINSRPSTLLTSRFDLSLSQGKKAQLAHVSEKRAQHVSWSAGRTRTLRGVGDLGLLTPLVALTQPRPVRDCFGNIIRRVDVGGEAVPASAELESAITALPIRDMLPENMPGPVSVWAVVTPSEEKSEGMAEWLRSAPAPLEPTLDAAYLKDLTAATTMHLSKLYALGGRFYKILSGGGGWGAKQGLLSLDPQRTHFAPSEEESLDGFIKTMEESSFTPRGSRIQFFLSAPSLPEPKHLTVPGISLGVDGRASDSSAEGARGAAHGFIEGHFGALSNDSIYLSGPGLSDGETTRLSVQHSRVFVADQATSNEDILGQLLLPDTRI